MNATRPALPPTILHSNMPEPGPRISRRRLFLLAAGGILGVAGGFKLLRGFGGFRINQVEASTPAFDPATFRLTIDGAVDRPLTLTMEELRALPSVSQVSDFHCVEGWGVNDVRWRGVRMQTLIDMVQPRGVAYATFHSLDGVYRDSLSLTQLALPDVLVAYDLYEKPLPPRHGLPLRLVAPHMYGYKGAKWLTRIEFSASQEVGYWEKRGWQIDGWVS